MGPAGAVQGSAVASDTYTHGHHDAVLRSHRWRTAANSAAYLLPRLEPGQRLLDVGCGPGTLTVDLARVIAPGDVVGVDLAPSVVAEAAEHASASGVANVSFRAGDFRTAELPGAPFDVVHAHQVLQHVGDPVGAMRAMAERAVPGGLLAARDSDYTAFTWSPDDERLDEWRAVYLAVTRRNGADASAGRWLLRWARQAGWADVTYSSSTWTFATAEDRAWWSDLWAERCVASSFGQQAVDYGITTTAGLERLAAGWRAWGADPDAVFVVVHGEVVGRRSGGGR